MLSGTRSAVRWLAVMAAAGSLIRACGSPARPAAIAVSANSCGTGWPRPAAGWHTFQIHNG